MALQPLKIIKNWFKNSRSQENNWDEIVNNIISYASRTNNNLNQIGLDINGSTYSYNNNGVATQTTSIVSRLTTLEATVYNLGTQNIGLDLSVAGSITICGSNGAALSASNIGYVTFNETNDAGDLITRNVTANITLALAGCHWGYGTYGDLTDHKLYLCFIDSGSDVVFGVANRAGRETVTVADVKAVATTVNTGTMLYANSTVSTEKNCTFFAWIKADFDDTGNVGGEDFWTINTSVGDINFQPLPTTVYAGEINF